METEQQVRRKKIDRQATNERRRLRREAARAIGGHRATWGRDGWKCQDCGKQARSRSGALRMVAQACGGHLTTRIPRQEARGPAAHTLWTAEADESQRQGGANVSWCSTCGAFSSTKLYNLGGPCGGPAKRAALTRLRSLQKLVHPVLGYRLGKPHRMTDELMAVMVSQAAERRRLYAEAVKAKHGEDAEEDEMDASPEPESIRHGGVSSHAIPSSAISTNAWRTVALLPWVSTLPCVWSPLGTELAAPLRGRSPLGTPLAMKNLMVACLMTAITPCGTWATVLRWHTSAPPLRGSTLPRVWGPWGTELVVTLRGRSPRGTLRGGAKVLLFGDGGLISACGVEGPSANDVQEHPVTATCNSTSRSCANLGRSAGATLCRNLIKPKPKWRG